MVLDWLTVGVTWDIYLRELLCHREEVLSGVGTLFSESVVFHVVFWVSSFVVLFWVVWCLGLFCFAPGFLLFTSSRNELKKKLPD